MKPFCGVSNIWDGEPADEVRLVGQQVKQAARSSLDQARRPPARPGASPKLRISEVSLVLKLILL